MTISDLTMADFAHNGTDFMAMSYSYGNFDRRTIDKYIEYEAEKKADRIVRERMARHQDEMFFGITTFADGTTNRQKDDEIKSLKDKLVENEEKEAMSLKQLIAYYYNR